MRVALLLLTWAVCCFVVLIGMFWVPALTIGCVWPNELADIISMNIPPRGSFSWLVDAVQRALPIGWGLEFAASDGEYWSCVSDQSWNIFVLVVVWTVFFTLVVAPASAIVGWLAGRLTSLMLK